MKRTRIDYILDAILWARKHCPSYCETAVDFDSEFTRDYRYQEFHFQDSKDAMIFSLNWSN